MWCLPTIRAINTEMARGSTLSEAYERLGIVNLAAGDRHEPQPQTEPQTEDESESSDATADRIPELA